MTPDQHALESLVDALRERLGAALRERDDARAALASIAADGESLARTMRDEVERGVTLRQSAEAKLARAAVAEVFAEQARRALKGGAR